MKEITFAFVLAKTAGFCWGVMRAINGAKGKERKVGERIHVLGALVHNQDAVADLEGENIHLVKNMEEARGETLLITAHGRSPKDIVAARKIASNVLDMTCPIVQDLHKAALNLKSEGRTVILIGMRSRRHPEVEGLIGVLGGIVHIVETARDIELLPLNENERIGVVAQTTFNELEMIEFVRIIKNRFKDTNFIPTICDDISKKQIELREKGSNFDLIIVVGDKKSANATHLAEIARNELMKPTLFVLNATELESRLIENAKNIFVTASASTPPRSIGSVLSWLTDAGGQLYV
ncbi:MAG: 4-hydroxy-3-methylbut-2-enyl diphosphate reductase [Patescibacteria group bacterium]